MRMKTAFQLRADLPHRDPTVRGIIFLLLAACAAAQEIPYRELKAEDFRIDQTLKLPGIMQTAGFFHLSYAVRAQDEGGKATARVTSWRVRSGFDQSATGRISPKLWKGTPEQMA